MIILYGACERFGLPEASPFVMKTEVQLKMAGLEYRKAMAAPGQSPKGQVPFMDDGGTVVADSHFIREHLEARLGLDFDEGLDPVQRATAWAIERMVENQLSAVVGWFRWMIPSNFEKGPAHFFDDAPEAVREAVKADALGRVEAAYKAMGAGRHEPEEILALGDRSLAALSLLLGDKTYFMGERPCGLDAAAFGVLASALTPFFDSPLRRRAERYGNLVAYTDRMMGMFYPDFAWKQAEAMAA